MAYSKIFTKLSSAYFQSTAQQTRPINTKPTYTHTIPTKCWNNQPIPIPIPIPFYSTHSTSCTRTDNRPYPPVLKSKALKTVPTCNTE